LYYLFNQWSTVSADSLIRKGKKLKEFICRFNLLYRTSTSSKVCMLRLSRIRSRGCCFGPELSMFVNRKIQWNNVNNTPRSTRQTPHPFAPLWPKSLHSCLGRKVRFSFFFLQIFCSFENDSLGSAACLPLFVAYMILLVIHGLQFCFSWRLRFFFYFSCHLTTPKRRWSLVGQSHVSPCVLSIKPQICQTNSKIAFYKFPAKLNQTLFPCTHKYIYS